MATTTTTATPAAPLARARPPVPKFREPVFLVDMAAFKPPDELRIDVEACSDACWSWKHPDGKPVSAETHEFVKTVFLKSGIAKNGSYLPANLHPLHAKGEPRGGQAESFAEARLVMGGVVTDLLERNGLKPTDIDILVTGSSIFCPTPSLGSMLINQLKMREDVQAFHLGGMGCGNGVIGLTLMRSLLSSFPGARAVFVTAEICSSAFYRG
jgi:3-ketoacyl-CoA synthase